MNSLNEIAFYLVCLFGALMLLGLIRPFIVLWWTKNHSRGKVLGVYGALTVVSAILYFASASQQKDTFKSNTSPKDSTFREQSR